MPNYVHNAFSRKRWYISENRSQLVKRDKNWISTEFLFCPAQLSVKIYSVFILRLKWSMSCFKNENVSFVLFCAMVLSYTNILNLLERKHSVNIQICEIYLLLANLVQEDFADYQSVSPAQCYLILRFQSIFFNLYSLLY